MPEGPEIHLASNFVNICCKDRTFGGKIIKNPIHKSSDVDFESSAYSIAAVSRGKEMQLILTKLNQSGNTEEKTDRKWKIPESLKILFRFGMSGNFQFTKPDDMHKHAHLNFFTRDKLPPMVLSYVDIRRFGRWEVGADWSKDRGPDPMFDYQAFRSNVVSNLQNVVFSHPICEVMLNQKYFNGIGNYLRAEILYRLGIPPFEKARTVLERLSEEPPDVKLVKGGKGKGGKPDLLYLCNSVPLEVIGIGAGGYTADGKASADSDFRKWLQCYYQDGMDNMVDHNKRTIWFTGPAGPLVPKDEISHNMKGPEKRKPSNGGGDKTPAKMKDVGEASTKTCGEEKENPNAGTTTVTPSTTRIPPPAKKKRRNNPRKCTDGMKTALMSSRNTSGGKSPIKALKGKGREKERPEKVAMMWPRCGHNNH